MYLKKKYIRYIHFSSTNLIIQVRDITQKVSIQNSNLSKFFFFKLCVDFENIIIGLHVLIISFILAKLQEDKKLIDISSITLHV